MANRGSVPMPVSRQIQLKKLSNWKNSSIYKKKMMDKAAAGSDAEEGNANLTSSDECLSQNRSKRNESDS